MYPTKPLTERRDITIIVCKPTKPCDYLRFYGRENIITRSILDCISLPASSAIPFADYRRSQDVHEMRAFWKACEWQIPCGNSEHNTIMHICDCKISLRMHKYNRNEHLLYLVSYAFTKYIPHRPCIMSFRSITQSRYKKKKKKKKTKKKKKREF